MVSFLNPQEEYLSCNLIYSFTENSMKKVLKPDSLPSKNIPCDNKEMPPAKRVINKCGICNQIICKERYAFGLKSAGSLATINKWTQILGGKKFITPRTSICYIHFKPSDFLKSKYI